MGSKEFQTGRNFVVRGEHDTDLVVYLAIFAEENNISAAVFTALGALKDAKLGFYDQKRHVYGEIALPEPVELVSCVGNISLKDGQPFVHAHAVLSDEKGNARGGHLLGGTIFAAEVHITELLGEILARKLDKVTGLSLWDF